MLAKVNFPPFFNFTRVHKILIAARLVFVGDFSWFRGRDGGVLFALVLHKIQDRYTQDQDKTRLVYKFQEILSKLKTLENIDELIFYYGHRPKKECFRKRSSPLNITI